MNENVPTFGRENLADGDKPTWDYWAAWHRQLTEPEEPESP